MCVSCRWRDAQQRCAQASGLPCSERGRWSNEHFCAHTHTHTRTHAHTHTFLYVRTFLPRSCSRHNFKKSWTAVSPPCRADILCIAGEWCECLVVGMGMGVALALALVRVWVWVGCGFGCGCRCGCECACACVLAFCRRAPCAQT